jgi:hypothetical protein
MAVALLMIASMSLLQGLPGSITLKDKIEAEQNRQNNICVEVRSYAKRIDTIDELTGILQRNEEISEETAQKIMTLNDSITASYKKLEYLKYKDKIKTISDWVIILATFVIMGLLIFRHKKKQ